MSVEGGQSTDIVMSGRYEMDASTGKLLNPARHHTFEKPEEMTGMHENTAWGARRFSEYFIQVLDYTWNSGDTTLLREVSLSECVWCAHYIQVTDERSNAGGWVDNAKFTVALVEDAFEISEHPGLWNTTLKVIQHPRTVYDGQRVEIADENRAVLYVQTQYADGKWKVWAVIAEVEEQ